MPDVDPPIERTEFENQLFGDLPPGLDAVPEFSPLTAEEVGGTAEAVRAVKENLIADLPSTATTTWNPEQHTAVTQAKIAFRLIWVLVGVIAVGAVLLATSKWTGLKAENVSDFFGVAFGAVVTLATAATSFWFGSQKHRSPTREG